jgi:hypothetical protein
LASGENRGGSHLPAKLEEHDGVEHDGSEFGQKNPEVVSVKAVVFVFGIDPALTNLMLVHS